MVFEFHTHHKVKKKKLAAADDRDIEGAKGPQSIKIFLPLNGKKARRRNI